MTFLRKLTRINETAAAFICRRNIDYMTDVHIVGKVEGPGSIPISGVGVFVFKTGQIPKDGSLQPLPFVGASWSDGSFDIKFKYMWGNKTGWWQKQNRDTTFSLHFVHDDFNIEVVPVTLRGKGAEVVFETNLKLERLSDDEAQPVQRKGSRSQYLRKRDPEPGDPGESWDPDQPWPHEAAFGGDTFTIEGDCAEQNQRIVDGVRWAYWQLRNGNIVTDPGLRVCIMEHMNNASVSCSGGDCDGNTNGYNEPTLFSQSRDIVMCLGQIRGLSTTSIGLLAIHEWAHSCGWNHGDGKGVPGDSGVGLALAVTPRVAFNPQDKWVVTMGNRILVIVNNGGVFGHNLADTLIGPAFQLIGPPVAFNPQDKWVVTMGNRILVIRNDGAVFGHDLANTTIDKAFRFTGPPVAFNPQDKWVVTMGNRILVIRNDGAVFGHDLVNTEIKAAFRFIGPPVAFNPQDKWVVTMGNRILVIRDDGAVFGHDLVNNEIKAAFRFIGPPVAFNPQDKWVITMGNRILVIRNDGAVFGHDLVGTTINPAFQLI
jgi:roadblock/LC7 domain-containing protein